MSSLLLGVSDSVVGNLPLQGVHEVCHAAVVHGSDALVEPWVYVPVVLQGIEVQVPVAHCHRDVGGDLAFFEEGQEGVQGVPVTADLGAKGQGVQSFPEERQIAENQAVGAFYGCGELEGDVLGRSPADVLDDEADVGQVGIIFGDRDQTPPAPAAYSARIS